MKPEAAEQFFMLMAASQAAQAAASEALAQAFATMYGGTPRAVPAAPAAPKLDKAAIKEAEAAALAAAKPSPKKAEPKAEAPAQPTPAPAPKPAPEPKVEAPAPAGSGGEHPTEEEMRLAVMWVGQNKGGREAVVQLLNDHADGILVGKNVPPEKRAGVIAACEALGYPPF